MKRRSGTLVVLLAGTAWLLASQTGPRKRMKVEFRPLPLSDASAASALKLVDAGGLALLYATPDGPLGSNLSVARLNGGTPRSESLGNLGSLPERPSWDAIPAEGGAFSVVVTESGSAVSALSLMNTRTRESATVNRYDGFGVFGAPHFVKGDAGSISSVALEGSKQRPVLFPLEPDGGYAKFRAVDAPIEGTIQDARLIRAAKGYLLFAKVMAIGASTSARREASGRVIYPGILKYVSLNSELHSGDPPARPLGGQLLIDFDACAYGDGVAIFAATPKGYVIATGKLTNGVFAQDTWKEEPYPRPLGSPSILAVGSKLYAAAVAAGPPPFQVVMAEVK
ncbi:MAG TPA: hypothetical protein VGF59_20880 [Bryobacteraceae bacterium]